MGRWVRRFGVATGLLLVVGGAVLALAWYDCGFRGCPDVDLLEGYSPDEASVVVDRSGAELGKLYLVKRVVVPLDSLPAYVPEAFVAIEDADFWEHGGVDWSRMLGAAWANARAMRIEQGFSTITMQLARNLFPRRLPAHEETISRKLGEMRVARQIEDRYQKDEILEMYINQIYYGAGAWGIEASAQEYFDKSASELTLAEAAMLAALPRSPSRLNPRVAPERARARRDLVLRRMAEQERIGWPEARTAMAEPLGVRDAGGGEERHRAPYFVESVRRRLEAEFGPALYTGGYTVHTTLDLSVQRVVEEELARQLDDVEAGRYGPFRHGAAYPVAGADDRGGGGDGGDGAGGRTSYLQGAVVVMDPVTGDVEALVGGRDFTDSEFNRATQAERQPGSAFKPIVYATALEAGHPLTTPLMDSPIRIALGNGDIWTPQNYGGGYMGVVSMRQALIHSRNVPTVRLAQEVGIGAVVEMARRLGIGGAVPEVPAIALGAAEVTLLDMVAAYATFAALGRRPEPRLVTHVEDADGRIVWRNPPETEPVLEPAVAFLLTTVLQDVVDRGTATAVRGVGYRGVAAGKTGTTDDATDVWFIGYSPARVAGIWIGFDRRRPILGGATGGRIAAPAWGRVMRRVGPGTSRGWTAPPGVERRMVGP
ncbi:MAG: transglycosylase domain-containing protein, partial [Gemmatimonadota bacterium]